MLNLEIQRHGKHIRLPYRAAEQGKLMCAMLDGRNLDRVIKCDTHLTFIMLSHALTLSYNPEKEL